MNRFDIHERHAPPLTGADAADLFDLLAWIETWPSADTPSSLAHWSPRSCTTDADSTTKPQLCAVPDCTSNAQYSAYCLAHGGGKCCGIPSCSNSAQAQGFCKAHGGGSRCRIDGCSKSSQGGGLCRGHGGGKPCTEMGCTKGVQRGNKCTKHGGMRDARVQSHGPRRR
ncbi:Aste57867_2088 [Aphanomyces stellatus]|uniref:Aste57867_2088 protein n=1 Tax=Aphanomyces stellatus TaxID=120398 RepID=A0A485KAE7_9STRA|nr:hypothetical protein As57867_002083 [Aphanomyces stellatus]VFT79291.1 Aste57867_2088 [Aphanomyces stellatus]